MNISGDARFFEALKLIYLPLRLCHTLIDETTTLIYKKICKSDRCIELYKITISFVIQQQKK